MFNKFKIFKDNQIGYRYTKGFNDFSGKNKRKFGSFPNFELIKESK